METVPQDAEGASFHPDSVPCGFTGFSAFYPSGVYCPKTLHVYNFPDLSSFHIVHTDQQKRQVFYEDPVQPL